MNSVEKVMKLFTLALDAGAPDGEAKAAAFAAISEMRRAGLKLKDLGIPQTKIREVEKQYEPWWAKVSIPFGKHKGSTLGEIAEDDPEYLIWLGANVTLRGNLQQAVEAALEAVGV